ncbi:hypothetical protein C0993_008550 [Termitomyces sp. T159_Od127]|nr:hypothetical protein C0993_008550 [Termitomyces sp. T159_Od127]
MLCYKWSTKKVYSAFHVRFIESHQDTPPPTLTNSGMTSESQPNYPSIETIANKSNSRLTMPQIDEDEPTKVPNIEFPETELGLIPEQDTQIVEHTPAVEPISNTGTVLPRRSTRVSVSTMKATQNNQVETQTEKAIRESKESAERVRGAWMERRRAINELVQAIPMATGTDDVGAGEIDQIMTTLSTIEESDPGVDLDTPRTLEEAQRSADWQQWKKSYQDKVDSLRKM